jgi:outer membrane protein assembly factor BamB
LRPSPLPLVVLCLASFLAGTAAVAADWPAYRADAARSGVSSEELDLPAAPTWVYRMSTPPRPAWPEPGKELHRMDFDYAAQPVAAGGMVYFASSADDTVRAVDAASGALKWRYTTGGPIRFAPSVAKGRLYIASDDGRLHVVDAATGRAAWTFRAAPGDEQLVGNGRMISRWPLRSGVIVADGKAYISAGMWPSQGIYIYALDAQNGREIWRNDTSGSMYISMPHFDASAFAGVAPQGYMALSGDVLLVPTGRSIPAGFDRRTGRLLYYSPGSVKQDGGSFLTVSKGLYFNPIHPRQLDDEANVGEAQPRNGDGMAVYSVARGARIMTVCGRGRNGTASNEYLVLASGDDLYSVSRTGLRRIDLKQSLQMKKMLGAVRWTVPCPRAYAIALVGKKLLLGGADKITAFAVETGEPIWQQAVDGKVRGLAIAGGRLFASTGKGILYCFDQAAADVETARTDEKQPRETVSDGEHDRAARQIIGSAHVTAGYAIVLGEPDSRLGEAIAAQTKLHVITVLQSLNKAKQERERLLDAGVYGTRVVVQHQEKPGRLPYASYFADLVVVSGRAQIPAAPEVYRVLRPCGGVMCFAAGGQALLEGFVRAAEVPSKEVRAEGKTQMVVRGKLPGAGEWRYHWADGAQTRIGAESRVRLPLDLLWFGGPGPDRMMDRHWRTSTPLSVGGRVFVTGQDCVICFDAYNGRELWSTKIPGAGRWSTRSAAANFVADDTSVYVAVGASCRRLDQASGKTISVYQAVGPAAAPNAAAAPARWGYLTVVDELVIGSQQVSADPKAHPLMQYADTNALFALGKADGDVRWTWRAQRTVCDTSIAFDDRRLFVLDSTSRRNIWSARRSKGKDIPWAAALCALNLATGNETWRTDDVPPEVFGVSYADGVVVLKGATRLAAYDAQTGRQLWKRRVNSGKNAIIHGPWIICEPLAYGLKTGAVRRIPDAFTGHDRPWRFPRAYGCGEVAGCRSMLFFRSGTTGFFDMATGGTTTLGAVRPGCNINVIAANGLLILPEAASGCTCAYNFQTSLALVPGSGRRDTWYVFPGRRDPWPVKNIRLNIGAPGDRRDASGREWFSYPRPAMPDATPAPAVVLRSRRFYYRPNAKVTSGTNDPAWIYTSGVQGKALVQLDLVSLRPVVMPPCAKAPAIDGKLDDAAWRDAVSVPLSGPAPLAALTKLFARRDDAALYFGFRREAPVQDGKPVPFVGKGTGKDASLQEDDDFEFYLTDGAARLGLHFGVSSAGAKFEQKRWLTWRSRPDRKWDCEWSSAVDTSDGAWTGEVAIPLHVLQEAGLEKDDIQLNVMSQHRSGLAGALYLTPLRRRAFAECQSFLPVTDAPIPVVERAFKLRLHFAEPDGSPPGKRLFDVLIQGKTVFKDVDIAREAGGPLHGLVRECRQVRGRSRITVELVPKGPDAPGTQPLICALELTEEDQSAQPTP